MIFILGRIIWRSTGGRHRLIIKISSSMRHARMQSIKHEASRNDQVKVIILIKQKSRRKMRFISELQLAHSRRNRFLVIPDKIMYPNCVVFIPHLKKFECDQRVIFFLLFQVIFSSQEY